MSGRVRGRGYVIETSEKGGRPNDEVDQMIRMRRTRFDRPGSCVYFPYL